jgi:hypothetical protein
MGEMPSVQPAAQIFSEKSQKPVNLSETFCVYKP